MSATLVIKDGNTVLGEITMVGRYYLATLYVEGPSVKVGVSYEYTFEEADRVLRDAHRLMRDIDSARFYANREERDDVVGDRQ